ncbi:MAG: hypothetical protein ACI8T1_005144 [Verrucomicrobiales bacterium]|jgi:hypothetical protein
MLENRVGSLSSVVSMLHEGMVEVIGLSLTDSADVTMARIVVTDPDMVMQLFLEKGIPHVMTDVAVVELKDGAAGLSKCLAILTKAETNIHFSYPLLVRSENDRPLLAMHLEDINFATGLLEQQGSNVLCQEDLSR